jgi:hypothetical protein
MGGLGNQLFQYAFAILLAEKTNRNTILDPNIASIRQNSYGQAELDSYELCDQVSISNLIGYRRIFQKIFGFGIRKNLENEKFHSKKVFNSISALFSAYQFKQISIPKFATNIGYCGLDIRSIYNPYIGYFQSHLYTDQVKSTLKSIRPKILTIDLEQYKTKARIDHPLVVHVRLTDYRTEDNFGLLNENYYHKAISEILARRNFKKIWLFSDEPGEALKFIPSQLHNMTENISDKVSTTVETLEIMRLGHGYVLANSTFSWWGAYLSKNENPLIAYPSPWFAGIPDPSNLCPPEWLPIPR